MALDARTSQEQLTPEQRRAMLRAFGDRMLLKLTALDDPDDTAGVERAVRVAAVIERIYSRCDRAERCAPDPHKLEAERARNAKEAIHARHALASAISLQKINRKNLGEAWEAAADLIKPCVATPGAATPRTEKPVPATVPVSAPAAAIPETAPPPAATRATAPLPGLPSAPVEVSDYTDIIMKARADLGLGEPPPFEPEAPPRNPDASPP